MYKLKLSELKTLVENNKCFETESDYVIYDYGDYHSYITFVVPKELPVKSTRVVSIRDIVNPTECWVWLSDWDTSGISDLVHDIGIPFDVKEDSDIRIMPGSFYLSPNVEKPCFKPALTPSDTITHLLIKALWGGCFNSHRGCTRKESEKFEPTYFNRERSNGGGAGVDYWVIPVGYQWSFKKNSTEEGSWEINESLKENFLKVLSEKVSLRGH